LFAQILREVFQRYAHRVGAIRYAAAKPGNSAALGEADQPGQSSDCVQFFAARTGFGLQLKVHDCLVLER
jgi:hypothetical protein